MDDMRCSRPTKYLARSYLAVYLNSVSVVKLSELQLLASTSIILAVKVIPLVNSAK